MNIQTNVFIVIEVICYFKNVNFFFFTSIFFFFLVRNTAKFHFVVEYVIFIKKLVNAIQIKCHIFNKVSNLRKVKLFKPSFRFLLQDEMQNDFIEQS